MQNNDGLDGGGLVSAPLAENTAGDPQKTDSGETGPCYEKRSKGLRQWKKPMIVECLVVV